MPHFATMPASNKMPHTLSAHNCGCVCVLGCTEHTRRSANIPDCWFVYLAWHRHTHIHTHTWLSCMFGRVCAVVLLLYVFSWPLVQLPAVSHLNNRSRQKRIIAVVAFCMLSHNYQQLNLVYEVFIYNHVILRTWHYFLNNFYITYFWLATHERYVRFPGCVGFWIMIRHICSCFSLK